MTTNGPHKYCNGMTQKDVSCKRLVSWKDIIQYPRADLIPLYCRDHLKSNLVEERFHCLKYPDQFVEYDTYIPSYLEPHTCVLLREEMRKRPAGTDKAGYFYVLDIEDTTGEDLVHFKIGRTNTINHRLAEHNRRCKSLHPILLGYYPSPTTTNEQNPDVEDEQTTDARSNLGPGESLDVEDKQTTGGGSDLGSDLALSNIRPDKKVPYTQLLEQLVHLELADVAANNHPTLGIATGRCLGVNQPRQPCINCGYTHEEILSFRRLPELHCGLEYELLVQPVVQKWGGYVENFVSCAGIGGV